MKTCATCVVLATAAVGVTAFAFLGGAGPAPVTTAAGVATSAAAAAGVFAVDGVHSSVVFKIKHMGIADFYGRFNKVEGSFNLDKENATASTLNITIDANSIDSNNANRDKHLKSTDFFSVAEFPAITFVGKEFKASGESFEVKGDLTMHGVTKSVTVTVSDTGRSSMKGIQMAGIGATFTIKRSDFGVNYGIENKALADEVTIMVSLEGKQGA
jgi:polyisoprenoid-binding protein YceI